MNKEKLTKELNNLNKSIDTLNKLLQKDSNNELDKDILLKKVINTPKEDEDLYYIGPIGSIEYLDKFEKCIYAYTDDNGITIGNYFKSMNDAEKTIKALNIEHAIRLKRIVLNNGWEPDWTETNQMKYIIYFSKSISSNGIELGVSSNNTQYNAAPIFGYYEKIGYAWEIIDQFKDELRWYFAEYLPNVDKMYIRED